MTTFLEVDNFSPWDQGVLLSEGVDNIVAGLTDHLKVPDHCIGGLSIAAKFLFREG